MKYSHVEIVRLAYGCVEHPAVGSWLAQTVYSIAKAGTFSSFGEFVITDRQGPLARNLAGGIARSRRADVLLMVDGDQIPDVDPCKPAFFEVATRLMRGHAGPCVVSSPTPMLNGCVNVHEERRLDGDGPATLDLIRIGDAVGKAGVELVPACGTGLIAIDMRAFDALSSPFFSFRYDADQTTVVEGEDGAFTLACSRRGIPVYVAWDCWCGHSKVISLQKPKA